MPNCKWYHKDEPDIMQIFKLHFQGVFGMKGTVEIKTVVRTPKF